MYNRIPTIIFIVVLAAGATVGFPSLYDQQHGHCSTRPSPELSIYESAGVLTTEEASSSPHFPFPPGHPPKTTNGTIFTTLSENPEFSRLVKLVNVSDDIVSLLNDSSTNLTFFAVPNSAIPKRPPHRGHTHLSFLTEQSPTLGDIISAFEPFIGDEGIYSGNADDDRVKKFITAVLSYHIIPQQLNLAALTKNTTYPTRLSHVFGALNDEAIRIRFSQGLPFARVNFYSQVIKPDIGTSNGFIHVVNRPLAPPLAVFQTIFLLQQGFSTLSSAIQRTALTSALDYKFVPDAIEEQTSAEGSPVVTLFAPTNKAFLSLPRDLQLFLFSPFGERVLKKILQYHVVPDIALYTDWILNTTSDGFSDKFGEETVQPYEELPAFVWGSMPFGDQHPLREDPNTLFPKPDIIYNLTLPTALEGHALNVLAVGFPIRLPGPKHPKEIGQLKEVFVNGQKVSAYDGVALNGALHVIDKLVSPRRSKRRPHHDGIPNDETASFSPAMEEEDRDDWQNWEEWLLEWAEN
ncbi:hypothetical protein ACEPAF_4724 [Sanghuangporus sanghuang]